MESSPKTRPSGVTTVASFYAVIGAAWLVLAYVEWLVSFLVPLVPLLWLAFGAYFLARAYGLYTGARWAWNSATGGGRHGWRLYYKKDVLDFFNVQDHDGPSDERKRSVQTEFDPTTSP